MLEYLLEVFYEIGPCVQTGMGHVPLDDTHLRAWQENSGIRLQPWEAAAVIRCSREWVVWQARGSDPGCASPWDAYAPPGELARAKAEALRTKFRGMAAKP